MNINVDTELEDLSTLERVTINFAISSVIRKIERGFATIENIVDEFAKKNLLVEYDKGDLNIKKFIGKPSEHVSSIYLPNRD